MFYQQTIIGGLELQICDNNNKIFSTIYFHSISLHFN